MIDEAMVALFDGNRSRIERHLDSERRIAPAVIIEFYLTMWIGVGVRRLGAARMRGMLRAAMADAGITPDGRGS